MFLPFCCPLNYESYIEHEERSVVSLAWEGLLHDENMDYLLVHVVLKMLVTAPFLLTHYGLSLSSQDVWPIS